MRQADAAILGGDMNAIEAFDQEIHLVNGLKDAYLDTGGKEKPSQVAEGDNDQWGATWGQMAHTSDRKRYGLGRLDKIFYHGPSLEVADYQTFGMDVMLEGEAGERLLELEDGLEKPWVTDHLGVASWFRLPNPQ
jgi:tyrosyl-DNA phosphodiesterase 2